MKKIILLLALFPFLHKTTYTVSYVSCKPEEIMVSHKDETIEISLFNTKITKEDGWNYACDVIKDAKKLEIEIDPSSKIGDVIPVYLFADDKLIQEELIKQNNAYPMIKNPEYTYEKRLEEAQSTTDVMAQETSVKSKQTYPMVAPIFLGIIIFIWLIMLVYILRKRKRKNNNKNTKNTEKNE